MCSYISDATIYTASIWWFLFHVSFSSTVNRCRLCIMIAALSAVRLISFLILKIGSHCCVSTLGLKMVVMHLMWLHLFKLKCVGLWCHREPDYFHMWLWRSNSNTSTILFFACSDLSLDIPTFQIKWKSYWNDTCNPSLLLAPTCLLEISWETFTTGFTVLLCLSY